MSVIAAVCLVVVGGAVVLAVLATAWALLAVPPALVVGIAAWRGVSPRTVLKVVADQDDPGMGPSGMLP